MKIEELSIGNFVLYVDHPGVFRVVKVTESEYVTLLPHYLSAEQASEMDYIGTHVTNLRPVRFDSPYLDKISIQLNDYLKIYNDRSKIVDFEYTLLHNAQNAYLATFGKPLSLSGCIIDQPETKPEPVKDMEYVLKRLDEIVKWFEERGH